MRRTHNVTARCCYVLLPALLALGWGLFAPERTATAAEEKTIDLVFAYDSEKEEWIKEVTAAFHKSDRAVLKDGRRIKVVGVPLGSGETVERVMEAKDVADAGADEEGKKTLPNLKPPHLISPASSAYVKLGDAESRTKLKKPMITGKVVFLVRSPVVIAMWKPMAEALGWGKKPVGWEEIRKVIKSPQGWGSVGHPEWGAFKLGHTHPESSNSGLISLLAEAYAGAGKTEELTVEDAGKPATVEFLRDVERSVVHYGSSTGFFGKKMFANNVDYLSAAVLYENMVVESYDKKKYPKIVENVVAIYPKEGTFWSDHPVAVVNRKWVTDAHKEAADVYVKFLTEDAQQQKAVKSRFRPARLPAREPIDAEHGVNPEIPKVILEPPSVEAMKTCLDLWKQHKKHSRMVLVFDTSGNMSREQKLVQAKIAAKELIAKLGDDDSMALLEFNTDLKWLEKGVKVRTGRERLNGLIDGLVAGKRTALYDAVHAAWQHFQAWPDPDYITSVVVLTDGVDNESKLALPELLTKIKVDNRTNVVRVYTIAYGSDAEADEVQKVLKQISDVTQAKPYRGTPKNIRSIIREIVYFF